MIEDLILKFGNSNGVSGNEGEILNVAKDELSIYGETMIDKNGNLISMINHCDKNKKLLMLEAHIDQVGFLVTWIYKEGFIKVSPCGGIDPKVLIGLPVVVHGNSSILGVFCSTPPHLKREIHHDTVNDVTDLIIDTGIYDGSIDSIIRYGDVVTFHSMPRKLLNNRVSSVAIDNRAGMICLIRSIHLMSGFLNELDYSLTVVFSSQEETTGKGALTSSYGLRPEESIVVDVSFASQPGIPKHKVGDMDKGPMIGISPVLNREMSKKMTLLAQENKIPYQLEVMSGKTGTNADKISSSRHGVKTSLLSIPIRYMHTPIETVSIKDIEDTSKLIVCYIKSGEGIKE